jgi:rhodanese-related sulfurtransferase
MARITPEELHADQSGAEPAILDARARGALEALPLLLPARCCSLREIEARHDEVPRDRDVVVYCSDNELSSARVALR